MPYRADGSYEPTIPGLPPELERVPAYRSRSDAAWRGEYPEWHRAVLEFRRERQATCHEDPEARSDELILCANSPNYFATVWGTVQESRHGKGERRRRVGAIPYVPYAYQVQYVDWKHEIIFNEEWPDDGFVSKSRGVGITWAEVIDASHGWLFYEAWDP